MVSQEHKIFSKDPIFFLTESKLNKYTKPII